MKKINNRGFTLVELIIVVAVLGILVLIGAPRLKGQVDAAKLARIKHDVKVMSGEMEIALIDQEVRGFPNNQKDLNALVAMEKLYEKEGVASKIDASHIAKNGVFTEDFLKNFNKYYNGSNLGKGGTLVPVSARSQEKLKSTPASSNFGMGGTLVPVINNPNKVFDTGFANFSLDETYRTVPEKYKDEIQTKLPGTFYTNDEGKVYYEHDKPLTIDKEEAKCVVPESLGYEFAVINGLGTITGWNGTEVHLIIPDSFYVEVNGVMECVPVRVIGERAFMNGGLRTVEFPDSIEMIEMEAFKDNDLDKVDLPKGLEKIGDGAFQNNNITDITIPSGVTNVGSNAFAGNNFGGGSGGSGGPVITGGSNTSIGSNAFGGSTPSYRSPSPSDADIIFHPESGTIVSGNVSNKRPGSSLVIPENIEIDGEEFPVKEVSKGAYQGSGIISAKMPPLLGRIEDYAFAGNRIERVVLPSGIGHIGNYAFAFNELVHSKSKDIKPTIEYVEINGANHFSKIDKRGNIKGGVSGVNLLDHIFVTNKDNVVISERPKAVISADNVDQINAGRLINWSYENSIIPDGGSVTDARWAIAKDGRVIKTHSGTGNFQDQYTVKGQYEIQMQVKSSENVWSTITRKTFTVDNSAPTTPVISRTPGGNSVMPDTPITIKANSTDPDGDAVRYVWEGRERETGTYPLGRNMVRVKAVDSHGAESPWAAAVFFVADTNKYEGGLTLNGPTSLIEENGLEGATISRVVFNVPDVSGHNSSNRDYGLIEAYNKNTGKWVEIRKTFVSNGITMTENFAPGLYSKLRMTYHTPPDHKCMYNKANITYNVEYYFE